MKTFLSLAFGLLTVFCIGAPSPPISYSALDTTNSFATNGGFVFTRLQAHAPDNPGDTYYITINGTNIALLPITMFNPTTGFLPVKGTTNWLDSPASADIANGSLIVGSTGSSANRSTNYLYIPFGNGTPVGTPATEGGHPALYFDATGDLLYAWNPPTGWHIIGTNIYNLTGALINPTDWKVPYRVNATTLGDSPMHPTNTTDMVFDGSAFIPATNFVHEIIITNGATLGGVRITAWPIGTSDDWTNDVTLGALRPVDLTLPLMFTNGVYLSKGKTNGIFVSGSDGYYTNGAANVKWIVQNVSGNGVELEAQGNAGVVASHGGSSAVLLRANSDQVELFAGSFFPVTGSAIDLGTSVLPFRDAYFYRTNWENEIVLTNGMTLGGVRRTTWPSGGDVNPTSGWLPYNNTGTNADSPLQRISSGYLKIYGYRNTNNGNYAGMLFGCSGTNGWNLFQTESSGIPYINSFNFSQSADATNGLSRSGNLVLFQPWDVSTDSSMRLYNSSRSNMVHGASYNVWLLSTNNQAYDAGGMKLVQNYPWVVNSSLTNSANIEFWARTNNALVKVGGIKAASGYDGSGTHFLADDDTYKAVGGSGSGGNMTNTSIPSIVGGIAVATDTSGTQFEVTTNVAGMSTDYLDLLGTMHTTFTNQVLATDGSGNVVGGGAPVWTNSAPVTDMEGGTVYGLISLNPFLNGAVTVAQNYLTNFWGVPSYVISIGSSADAVGLAQGNAGILSLGVDTFSGAYSTNSSDLLAFGDEVFINSYTTNCDNIHGFGKDAYDSAVLDGCEKIISFSGLQHSHLTNSSDGIVIGDASGTGMSGTINHFVILGSGGMATNSNDFVFGDNAYNYFFPGASAHFDNSLSSSGTVSANALSVTNTASVNSLVASNGVYASGFTNVSIEVDTPSSIQTLAASGTIAWNAKMMRVAGNGGAVTLTSTPTIATNGVADGARITIRGTSDANSVTLQDYRTLAGSCLAMDCSSFTLLNGADISFHWSAANQRWQMEYKSPNSSMTQKFANLTVQTNINGPVTITNGSSVVGLSVQGFSGQTAHVADIGSGGTNYWYFDKDGNLLTGTDNKWNIGGSSSGRPGTINSASYIYSGAGVLAANGYLVGNNTMGGFYCLADGNVTWASSGSGGSFVGMHLGINAASPVSPFLAAASGSGTDKNGGSLTLEGGQSTGTGRGGDLILRTSISTNSSSAANIYSTRSYKSAKPVALTDATTNLICLISLPPSTYVGGVIDATVFLTDGSEFKSHNSGAISFNAVNKGGTITGSIAESSQLEVHVETAGTQITDTWSVGQSGNNLAILVTPGQGSVVTPTTYVCKWIIQSMNSNGPADVTPQ